MNERPLVQLRQQVSLVLAGAAGAGIQSMEPLITKLLRDAKYNVFSTSEFMSRIRGGSNSTQIRVTSHKTAAYADAIDILFPLDAAALAHCKNRLTPHTVVIGEKSQITTNQPFIDLPIAEKAKQIGGTIYANTIAASAIAALFSITKEAIEKQVRSHFAKKSADIIEKNVAAAHAGFALGNELVTSGTITIAIDRDESVASEYFMNGSESLALGALCAGCDFVSAYPMSPGTGVLTFMAEHKKEFGIIVEQAEDEIAAVNMAIGAWYAGARGLVPTAGGGFSLMAESLSLSGMIETPVVIMIGQRPGPATGLPTRTEQADLDCTLYSGHGDFPRAVFTPGTHQQAIDCMRKAFDMANKFQVPSLVLAEQFFLDSYSFSPTLTIPNEPLPQHIVPTTETYKRYALTESGVSPRGVPGNGTGIVCVDSDEHTESGYITEDLELRVRMVDKRKTKIVGMTRESLPPQVVGADNFETLVVCYGASFHCVSEALNIIGDATIGMLHVSQIMPLHPHVSELLLKAKKTIFVEGNSTGQFARYIRSILGHVPHANILKYNGMPFSVEELVSQIIAAHT